MNKNNNILIFKDKDRDIVINLDDMEHVDNFINIYYYNKINNDNYEVITGVIKDKNKIVVPFRKRIVSKEAFLNLESKINVLLFNNGKALYETDEYCYIINLNDVAFNKKGNQLIPNKSIYKFPFCYGIDDDNLVMYLDNGTSFIYNVNNNKIKSFIYDHIEILSEDDCTFKALMEPKEGYITKYEVSCAIDNEGNIISELLINDAFNNAFIAWPTKDSLKNKKSFIKYCDSCYDDYIKNRGDEICKILQ